MAVSYNKVMLMGNLTRDVELKYTQSNQAVATVGLAVNRRYKTAAGELKEEVLFVDCDAWGKTAENISKFFSKGRPIFIEGHLRLDTWQDKNDGSNRSKIKVVVENFHFVDSRPTDGSGGGNGGGGGGGGYASRPAPQARPAGAGAAAPAAGAPAGAPDYQPIEEQDIPF
jgi:single-strand DNA-binding protein